MSVNTITAALLGHFLLGEAFGGLHLLALLLAIGGAVLIWDPHTIGTSDPKVLGNALALLAGVSSGCMTICSRKAGKASSLMLGSSSLGSSLSYLFKSVLDVGFAKYAQRDRNW